MEELFVYALLFCAGYEKYDEYRDTLDNLFLIHSHDDELLDLYGREYKDAMLHLLYLMNETSFDIEQFGRRLMSKIQEIYEMDCLDYFAKNMYELWCRLPENICYEEPFYIWNYADEPLPWGDEEQCRSLYEDAIYYYDNDK